MKFDPLKNLSKCKTAISAIETGFRDNLYKAIAGVYRSARALCKSDSAYARFCELEFWNECKQKVPGLDNDHKTRFLFVCRYAFNARNAAGKRYNRAYKIARTLHDLFGSDVQYSEVAAELEKRGGAHYFYSPEPDGPTGTTISLREEGSESAKPAKVSPLRRSEDVPDDEDDAPGAAASSAESDEGEDGNGGRPRAKKLPHRGRPNDLIVEMDEGDLQDVLKIQPGHIAHLDIELVGYDGEWRRIKGRFHS